MLCRVCGSVLDKEIVKLENMPLTDAFLANTGDNINQHNEFIKDICIHECPNCFFVQNPVNFDFGEYYLDYNYSSGHSIFVQNFMRNYAELTIDLVKNNLSKNQDISVLEVGSGDGVQLKEFKSLGATVVGVEPSDFLAKQAESNGVPTHQALYDDKIFDHIMPESIDAIISSFTFDHMPDPVEYLKISHNLLRTGGILSFEVHDLNKIISRGEFCLFEHEHTIYLTPEDAKNLVEGLGFECISINPMPETAVRANSLIVYARKVSNNLDSSLQITNKHQDKEFLNIQSKIESLCKNLDNWIFTKANEKKVIGYGVGGRGVMTIANLKNAHCIAAMMDQNYKSNLLLTPKTHIPIISSADIKDNKNAFYLIFSFGYFDEIKETLIRSGVKEEDIFSLKAFYDG